MPNLLYENRRLQARRTFKLLIVYFILLVSWLTLHSAKHLKHAAVELLLSGHPSACRLLQRRISSLCSRFLFFNFATHYVYCSKIGKLYKKYFQKYFQFIKFHNFIEICCLVVDECSKNDWEQCGIFQSESYEQGKGCLDTPRIVFFVIEKGVCTGRISYYNVLRV